MSPSDPNEPPDALIERLRARTKELQGGGIEGELAHGIAWLEERVRQWPDAWGEELHVLIYGDFDAPPDDLDYPALGIVVKGGNREKTIIRVARTVLEAHVTVNDRSVPALIDAARRMNLLLGIYTLHQWGNSGSGWWSWLTHAAGGGIIPKLPGSELEPTIEAVLKLAPEVRRKIEAALFWIREPRPLLFESYRPGVLRVYSAYWNSFECLVEAVCLLKPRHAPTKSDKQSQIDGYLSGSGGRLTAEDVQRLYHEVVNPGFVGKGSHALSVCFGERGNGYAEECFRLKNKDDRLYNVRNAINHGEIDAENPHELLRIETRLARLWMIVWGMFGRIIPFPTPVDPR